MDLFDPEDIFLESIGNSQYNIFLNKTGQFLPNNNNITSINNQSEKLTHNLNQEEEFLEWEEDENFGNNVANDDNQFEKQKQQQILEAYEQYQMHEENDFYKQLNIQCNATEQEIKSAYRKLAIQYHPDKIQNLNKDIQEIKKLKFLEIKKAYKILSNPETRILYEKQGLKAIQLYIDMDDQNNY
ncbi:DnaJ domain [Pseudocohnilembus persalinus]|uniref:DnaJ domain n=1 Tax=Pseudocohnilembus persalinus TaxID=266149 RepID=A0A0V0R1W9_PSEPJ|nr:DnaJ domain [Pseudocohnilembus persalinus]|eukprot:KRX08491.1 DnaJ domain [Pseudocohnilembus persalinus]